MTAAPAPDQSDPTLRLPRDVYYVLIHTLRPTLPPPLTDSPEDRVRRDNAAIAEVASMLPANANEATLAARCVAANACAMSALAEARQAAANGDRFWQQKCTSQSISMMRESRAARALLLRLQSAREQREKDNAACDRVAWNEHCIISPMQHGLADAHPAEEPTPPSAPDSPECPPADPAEQRPDTEPVRRAAEDRPLVSLVPQVGGTPPDLRSAARYPAAAPALVRGAAPRLRPLNGA